MARPKKDGQFVTCYMRKDLCNRLEEYCEKTMAPKTAVLERALERFLNEQQPLATGGTING